MSDVARLSKLERTGKGSKSERAGLGRGLSQETRLAKAQVIARIGQHDAHTWTSHRLKGSKSVYWGASLRPGLLHTWKSTLAT